MLGGHQEHSLRAGTQNTPYIVGLGEAARLAKESLGFELTEVKKLRDKLENGIFRTPLVLRKQGFIKGGVLFL